MGAECGKTCLSGRVAHAFGREVFRRLGHGFGVGPAAGRLAADIIAGDTPIVDPQPYRYGRLVDGSDLGEPGAM